MSNTSLKKVGVLKVQNGKFRNAQGEEKTRWNEIGIVLATPHHSQMVIKLHANGFGEGQFANIFWDEDAKPDFSDRQESKPAAKAQVGNEISAADIPF